MSVRQPVAIITVLGQNVHCTEATANLSRDAKTDTLQVKASLSAGPDADFWSTANKMEITCTIIDGAGGSAQVFDGEVDSVSCDFGSGTVEISARDKSAKMLNKKSGFKHNNKKPHEIVQYYAGQSGLSVDADQISDKAGKTFQIDYDKLIHRMSDWHAVQHVAEEHGMIAYATNGKLYFKKIPESLPSYSVYFVPPINGVAQSNVKSLTAKRNVQLGKTIKTHVHSWNHKGQAKYEGLATESGGGDTLDYHIHHPQLTQSQANSRAKAHSDKAMRHELDVSVEIPGDISVTPRMNLLLSGTNSAWDQLHDISTVTHKVSVDGGFTTSISTKAKSKKRGR